LALRNASLAWVGLGEIAARHSRKILQNLVRGIGWLASAKFGPAPAPDHLGGSEDIAANHRYDHYS
jgi:hypothetical protein